LVVDVEEGKERKGKEATKKEKKHSTRAITGLNPKRTTTPSSL
jgi:hypothetical protein